MQKLYFIKLMVWINYYYTKAVNIIHDLHRTY